MRIGTGFDIHRVKAGAQLMLGGVEIPADFGLESDTDGDVVLHALMDAVLAAAGLPDIGVLFPPGSAEFVGVPSSELVGQVMKIAEGAGFALEQADIIVMAEEPKLSPHYAVMRARVSELFRLDVSSVSIKARTMEGLGAIGESRAIAAQAVVLGTLEVKRNPQKPEKMLDEYSLEHKGKIPQEAVIVNVDGGSRGNPGPAAAAAVMAKPDGEVISLAEFIGESTNNVAEYKGVLLGLRLLREYSLEKRKVIILLDSSLAFNQLTGRYKVKDANLRDLARQALRQMANFADVRMKLIPREENGLADAEVNAVLDAHSKASS
jgi:2-C-methyl-D-erythritol 2,4-cyclodiphosphate synthase